MDATECLICYESIVDDERRFGYPDCYDTHTFCKECFLLLIKRNLKCPIDQRDNVIIVFEKNNMRYELGQYDEGLIVDKIGDEHVQRKRDDVIPYISNICVSCLNEVSDDTNMFWRTNCPKSHRMCFDCLPKHDSYTSGCLMTDDRCRNLYMKAPKKDRFNRHYYSARATNVGPITAIYTWCINLIRYLQRRIDDEKRHNESTGCSIERVKEVLGSAKRNWTFPRDVCPRCLREIDGRKCSPTHCYKYHLFCENCVGEMIKSTQKCPIDGYSFKEVTVMDIDRIVYTMQVQDYLIREYLRAMGVRNARAQAMLETMEASPCCYGAIPDTLCLGCFTDIAGVVYRLRDDRRCNHNYCEECASEITLRGNQSPIDNDRYHNIDILVNGRYEYTFMHHFRIIEFAREHGIELKETWWRNPYQYIVRCMKFSHQRSDTQLLETALTQVYKYH